MNQQLLSSLINEIRLQNLDAFFLAPSAELTAIAGISPFYCFRVQGLLICADGSCSYICNLLSADEIRKALPEVKIYTWHDNDGYLDTFRQAFHDLDLIGKQIGVNKTVRAFDVLAIMTHMSVKFTDASELFPEISIRKSAAQIGFMRKAAEIAGAALTDILPAIHPGMSESELRQILIDRMHALGGTEAEAMIASGPNSGYPHYFAEQRILETGDAIIIDYGCAYQNYRTDITRMVYLGGISDEQLELYRLVHQANEAAISLLKSGERWIPSIDAAAREFLTANGYGAAFTTRLGHGIGVMGHEAPEIKACNQRYLEPGMCFSIEPGLYLGESGGVRVEDCVCILPDGQTEVLTACVPKEPIILP